MTCNEINKHLPAYLENDLTPDIKRIVEEHLATCEICNQALADFKMTLDLLKDLPGVEPPSFFEQKVMSRIRDEATPKEGILKKLFHPLRIKLPLQAMATICIAAFAFLVYKGTEQDLKQITPLPLPNIQAEKHPSAPVPSAGSSSLPLQHGETTDRRITDRNQSAPIFSDPRQKEGLSDKKAASLQPTLRKERPSPVISKQRNRSAGIDEIERPETKEPGRKPLADTKRKVDMAYLGAKQEPEEITSGPPMTALAREILQNPSDALFMDLSVQVTDMEAAVPEIENFVHQIKGRIIESRQNKGNGFMKVEVDSEHVPALLDRLGQIGQILKGQKRHLQSDIKTVVLIKLITPP